MEKISMPTGYTAIITEDPNISFEQFALRCSRGFGACIMMRDNNTVAVPNRKDISDNSLYYEEQLEDALKNKAKLEKQSPEDTDFINYSIACHNSRIERIKKYIEDIVEKRYLYNTMLEKVEAWVAPTSAHVEFKNFMINQIKDSIEFDCRKKSEDNYKDELKNLIKITPGDLNYKQLYQAEIISIDKDISYYTKELNNKNERNMNRIKWMEDLYDSLNIEFK